MSAVTPYPSGVEAEVLALRQALMQAEERVQELTDLAAQLRRRLALRQTHDDERCRELKATIAQLRRRPAKSRVGEAKL